MSHCFTLDADSLRCHLGDLEEGAEDHPDNFSRVALLQPVSQPEVTGPESMARLQEEYSQYIKAQFELESDLALINAELEALQIRKNQVFQKRLAVKAALEPLLDKSAQKIEKQAGRYFAPEGPAKLPAKAKDKISQAEVADVLCYHEISGDCLDPQCPYFHTSR